MPGPARRDVFNPFVPGVHHCISRCVRRAFLCGVDRYSKKNFDHRRDWIEARVAELARSFAIDVAFFAILGNHLHLLLRNLPQLVAKWSDKEVMQRSCRIYPSKFKEMGVKDGEMTVQQLREFCQDRELVAELRERLSHISWFMRQLKHYIARKANEEDCKTGHFFEARFKLIAVTDERGVLICGIYIDLNQIRAEEAETPETSERTSAYRRIKALHARRRQSVQAAEWDGFLSPLSRQGDGQKLGYRPAGMLDSLRASDTGLLEMSLPEYLKLLDWAGRQLRRDKRGRIPADAPPILERLGLNGETLIAFVEGFEELFQIAVGSPQSMTDFATSLGRRWLKGGKKIVATEQN